MHKSSSNLRILELALGGRTYLSSQMSFLAYFNFDLPYARFSRSNLSIDKMTTNLRVEDRLDGAVKLKYWKHRILLILEENDILNYVKEVIPKP